MKIDTATIALIVSIVGTVFNVWYTRRTFKVANDPVVDIYPELYKHDLAPFQVIQMRLKNHSENINLLHVHLEIEVDIGRRGWRLRRKQWILFGEQKESADLLPGEERGLMPFTPHRVPVYLEKFLHEHYSGLVKADQYDTMVVDRDVYIRMSASYETSRHGKKYQHKTFRLTPIIDDQMRLVEWNKPVIVSKK